jgi:hypothetical protein
METLISSKEAAHLIDTLYPLQVTQSLRDMSGVEVWRRFLIDKGFKTFVDKVLVPTKSGIVTNYVLYRSLSQEEVDGLSTNKYMISDHFIQFNKYYDYRSQLRQHDVDAVCSVCGGKFRKPRKSELRICNKCALTGTEDTWTTL